MIPDFDHPLGGTSEEDAGDVGVPRDVVDGGVVCRIRLQESGRKEDIIKFFQNFQILLSVHSSPNNPND